MNINIQPTASGITYCRSPIVYQFTGLNQNNLYDFNLYVKTGSTTSNFHHLITIRRTSGLNNEVNVNVDKLLEDFIMENPSYLQPNVVRYLSNLVEYDSGLTYISTITSNSGHCTMGYTEYCGGGGKLTVLGQGRMNISDSYYPTEYIMNSQTYSEYSLAYDHYEISFRHTSLLDYYNYYTFEYYDVNGQLQIKQEPISTTYPFIYNEVFFIACGYKDLVDLYGYTDIDINRPYSMKLITVSNLTGQTFNFVPDQCNDWINLQFLNKWGVWDFLHFYGKQEDELNVNYETYKYNRLSSNLTYQSEFGQYHKSFIQGRKKLIVNSGWLDEVKNEKIQQLLLSPIVFNYTTRRPYIITDKTLKFKTEKWNKLIEYTLTLEEGFDTINSVF